MDAAFAATELQLQRLHAGREDGVICDAAMDDVGRMEMPQSTNESRDLVPNADPAGQSPGGVSEHSAASASECRQRSVSASQTDSNLSIIFDEVDHLQ
jgi:hypothetical protein